VPQRLIDDYLALLNGVEDLALKKPEMEEDAYYSALEALLVQAARANRLIREREKTEPTGR
ncbi:hypothetical protein MUP05_03755, partial [Candidatus Bathyarchaeota archaeon]|nr:hypothetical protein [Candidatus Bathyarchaeota archaeon]